MLTKIKNKIEKERKGKEKRKIGRTTAYRERELLGRKVLLPQSLKPENREVEHEEAEGNTVGAIFSLCVFG